MTKRLQLLFDEIENCEVFADVGCDHGYIAEAVLKSGKSEKVIISDISEKSLQKAKNLLCEKYADRVKAVVADGFNGIDDKIDEALIAGMGGEEIAGILTRAKNLPKRLILSPQHNSDKVRIALLNLGYYIKKDTSFLDGKLYYLIVAEKIKGWSNEGYRGRSNEVFKEQLSANSDGQFANREGQFAEIFTGQKQVYTEDEICFGKDNINTQATNPTNTWGKNETRKRDYNGKCSRYSR